MDYFFIRFKLVIKKFIFIHGDLMNVLGDILVGIQGLRFFYNYLYGVIFLIKKLRIRKLSYDTLYD